MTSSYSQVTPMSASKQEIDDVQIEVNKSSVSNVKISERDLHFAQSLENPESSVRQGAEKSKFEELRNQMLEAMDDQDDDESEQ